MNQQGEKYYPPVLQVPFVIVEEMVEDQSFNILLRAVRIAVE